MILQQLINGAMVALQATNILVVFLGTVLGISVGALPGLTATMGVGLLIPVTFGMDPVTGLLLLAGVYCGAIYGGSISAILLNTPGTPSSAATTFDGYKMTKNGEAGKALATSTISSFIGGIISAACLILIAPPLGRVALKFGPAEYFAVAVFGLTIICSLTSKSLPKGLISGLIGLLISTIGMDPVTGFPRFTFGKMELLEGVFIIPALIGLFSMSQVLILTETVIKDTQSEGKKTISDKIWLSFKEFKSMLVTIIKSSFIGTFIGIIPGAGGDIASFMGYNEAKRFSKNKEKFGTGYPEGVAASEAANNAVTGGSLVPLLTLGVPGNSVTAVLLGGLMIQGLTPGPEMFTKHSEITYAFLMGLILANVAMLILGLGGAKVFVKVLNIPNSILIPIIFCLSVIGPFALRNSMFDVFLMFLFGILGYLMRKAKFQPAPVILGMILGPMAERNFRRVLLINQGGVLFILTKPIALFLIILSIISIAVPIIQNKQHTR